MGNSTSEKNSFFIRHSKLSIIAVYNLGIILGYAIFYPLIPILMGYSPNVCELSSKIGVSYDLQYIILILFSISLGTCILLYLLKGVGRWQEALDNGDFISLQRIRETCINLPYTIFILQISIIGVSASLLVGIIGFMTHSPISLLLKLSVASFSLFSLIAGLSHILSRNLFIKILLKTYKDEGLQGRRIGIKSKIFLQILPMFIVACMFTSMIAYSCLIEEKGDLVYELCKLQLKDVVDSKKNFSSAHELFNTMKTIKGGDAKISFFVVGKDSGAIITSDGYIPSAYFEYFAKKPLGGDRVYGDSFEIQGVVSKVKINGQDYFAGVRFENASDKTINFFLFTFLGLLILNIFVVYYFSKTLTNEISLIAESLGEIANGNDSGLDKKIAVISNDELGDLVVAYNKVQEREKEHFKKMQENQSIIAEQNRLSSLGQLIGGISHNLKTPIMSLAGAIEGLKALTNEFQESIDDETVTKEDYYEIANEMKVWLQKMKPYCAYMTDIITAVKEQTVRPTLDLNVSFTVKDLKTRCGILFDNEIRKRNCQMSIDSYVADNTKIMGQVSDIVQVLNNLIINAVHAYEDEGGDIIIKLNKKDNSLIISVTDYGKGIAEHVQEKLFKEMITTKGKDGTGLGLYMSHTNIKARFGGSMWFESHEGKGTTIYVSLPIKG